MTDDQPPAAGPALVAEISERARALSASPGFPAAEVERIRRAAGRLDAVDVAPGDVDAALALVERRSAVAVVVPGGSRRSVRGLARWAAARVGAWHAHQAARHLSLLGQATVVLGTAARERIEALEATVARQQAELDQLRAGVESTGGGPSR
ncbi:MAG TPA: hypothetical protein VM263_09255 [Acidimicrobiales bacterium]|nr:hypothetical protein [Acidimicrobiales bacterium]